jgi:hypothetical protein
MGERNKLNYEIPKLVALDGATAVGTGRCEPSGSAASNCLNGNAAGAHSCTAGAGASCSTGNLYVAQAMFQLLRR